MESNNLRDALTPGTLLQGDQYEYKITEILGQGSFGITYKAQLILKGKLGSLTSSSTMVAIKEFFMNGVNGRPEGSSQISVGNADGMFADYMRRFRREAQNLGQLEHPNIIQVLESFESNNTSYYVMEYLEGGSLEDKLKREGRITENEAKSMVTQMGSALSLMHDKHMLHLDLKPGNVMLKQGNFPVLIDFGLSKHFDETGAAESSTKIGGGTPGYSPLEQSTYKKGEGFPATMDVYALGATMFKMLTGQRPPEASDILNEGFPSHELRHAGVSEHTIAVITKAMAPIKKDRYQTVAEFVEALNNEALEVEPEEDFSANDASASNFNQQPGFTDAENENTMVNPGQYSENTSYVGQDEHTVVNNADESTGYLDIEDDEPEPKRNNTTKLVVVFVGCAFVVCVVLLFMLGVIGGSKKEKVNDSEAVEEIANPTVTDLSLKNKVGSFRYSGEINDAGQPNGKGTAKFSNGNVYEGEWVDGKMEGKCKYTLSNGDQFEGTFINDFYERGRYTIKQSGEYFEGSYLNGNPDKGSWYDKNGKQL